MSQNVFTKSISTLILGLSLTACGGGGASGGAAVVTSALSGTAAVGFAVVNGTVNIKCANSIAIAPSTTSAAGAIQVNLAGQTLPCALQVTGGTINGVANTNNYHSIATSAGNVNVTPLTDLLVANLAGTATPTTWFAGLTTAQLAAITAGQVTTAATNVKTALGLTTQLAGIDLITTAFTPTRNNVMDNTLEALQAAITNNATPYTTLLTNAGASANAGFTTPAGFNAALTAAYVPPGGATTPTVTGFSPATGAVGTVVTITGTNLGLGFQPAPIVKFGTTAVTTPLTFNGQTSISFAVPTGLAAGAHTITIGGMTGVPLTVGTFTVTAAPVIATCCTRRNATATAASATQINLSWTAVAGASSYNIYRGTAAGVLVGAASKINATPITVTTFNSTGLFGATPYFYVVTAVNVNGESVGSAEVSATTSAVPVGTIIPAAPIQIVQIFSVQQTATGAAAPLPTKIQLIVSGGGTGVGYNFYRSTFPNVAIAAANLINPTPANAFYTDNGLSAATKYYYKVTAVNAAGEGPASPELATHTPLATLGSGAGLTLTPSFGLLASMPNAIPYQGGSVLPSGYYPTASTGTSMFFYGNVVAGMNSLPRFNLEYRKDSVNTEFITLNILNGTLNTSADLDVPAVNLPNFNTEKRCTLGVVAGETDCVSKGITLDRLNGTVTFVNTPMIDAVGTVFSISGSYSFVPF